MPQYKFRYVSGDGTVQKSKTFFPDLKPWKNLSASNKVLF
jgi:hypothetical protein